jgi:hypothetical protein
MALPRLAAFGATLPDLLTAAAYLCAWVAPLHFGDGVVKTLMLMMLMEFLVVHSGGFIGLTVLSETASRRAKTTAIVGFGAFYLLFAAAFSLAFKSSWPVLSFLWLLAAKFAQVWLMPLPRADEAQRQTKLWGLSVVAYIGAVFAGVILPIPQLGITADILPRLGLSGGGLWIDKPQTALASGALYFLALAWTKWTYSLSQAMREQPRH